jgi:hypothetical protein
VAILPTRQPKDRARVRCARAARIVDGLSGRNTHPTAARRNRNYERIVRAVIAPALADPDGASLDRCLAEIAGRSESLVAAE